MYGKEGDEMGIDSIRERLELDDQLIDKIFRFLVFQKGLIRNAVPTELSKEIMWMIMKSRRHTSMSTTKKTGKVKTIEKPFVVKDDEGVEVYSLLAPPVALSLIKQLVRILGL